MQDNDFSGYECRFCGHKHNFLEYALAEDTHKCVSCNKSSTYTYNNGTTIKVAPLLVVDGDLSHQAYERYIEGD